MTSIKLLLISDIKYSDRLTKGSVEYIPKGTICESTLEMWHECQPGTRYLRTNIPITIKVEKIGSYNRCNFILLSKWREKQINSILED